MARIDLFENYAVNLTRQSVRDSLMSHGEEAILLSMYHANADKDFKRCPSCWDEDYNQPEDNTCTICYGTTFYGGVKQACRAWAIFTDQNQDEEIGKRGVWASDKRKIQTEPFPNLIQHDFVVRIRRWSRDHKPLEVEGFYVCGEVSQDSIRTGNKFGQYSWDSVGQNASLEELSSSEPITKYPVLGKSFPRWDGKVR